MEQKYKYLNINHYKKDDLSQQKNSYLQFKLLILSKITI
jgi:hypothetical protein